MEDEQELIGELIYYAHSLPQHLNQLHIRPIGDAHRGNPLFSEPHFDRAVESVRSPGTYTLLTGDLCEAAIRSSKGEIFRQVGTPQDQRDWMIEKLYPIRKKILGCIIGNHEERILNDTGIDISKDIATALGVPYRPEGMIIKISFGAGNSWHPGKPYTYWGYFTHGHGGARTKAAKAVKVERVASYVPTMDFVVMSHDHVVNAAPDVALIPDARTRVDSKTGFSIGKVAEHRKLLVKTNAFVKWGGYAERGGFPPSDLSPVVINLAGQGKPRVTVEV